MMKNKMVNVAVQILPFSKTLDVYDVVDKAIAVIAKSGVKYRVTPFETVMEGRYDILMQVVEQVQQVCYEAGTDSVLCYLKIQSHSSNDVKIEDKTGKYE
jgi:uncharacterized protein YqgV (UPF0045/DUF77 family)